MASGWSALARLRKISAEEKRGRCNGKSPSVAIVIEIRRYVESRDPISRIRVAISRFLNRSSFPIVARASRAKGG